MGQCDGNAIEAVLKQALRLVAVAIGTWGCTAPDRVPDANLLRDAEQLCLDAKFTEAEPMLREYLRQDSEDAVAHYYLGRCNLSGDLINLAIARGEFAAALSLFHKHGQTSPAKRFTDEYFELMCLTDTAKTYLSEIALIVPQVKGSKADRVREAKDRVARCEALYELAKQVNPNAELTSWLRMHTANAAAHIGRE